MATGRADEAVRPSQPFQVVEAVRISREPSPQLPKGLRVVDAGERSLHPSSICSSPVKWIAQTLDIDDTADTVHGHQQLSLFNAHHDERCFMPVHVYDADTGHCILTILRPGKTPDGKEVRGHIRRLVRRIRLHWPHTRITIRGDGHYGRREAMDWCEKHGVDYIFGLSTNAVLAAQVFAKTDDVCVRRAIASLDVVRNYTETQYGAKSWSHL